MGRCSAIRGWALPASRSLGMPPRGKMTLGDLCGLGAKSVQVFCTECGATRERVGAAAVSPGQESHTPARGNSVFSRVSARPSTDRPTRAANSPAISKAAWVKLFRITRSSNSLLAVALLRLSPILKLCRGTGTTVMGMSFSWNAAKVSEYKKDSACRLSQDPREPRGRLLDTASIEIAALRKTPLLDLLSAIDGGR